MTIVGARPQFIKLFPISHEIRKYHNEIIVHTGQHYDFQLSDIFFKELGINTPEINLEVGSGSHGLMTGKMIIELEKVFVAHKPDMIVVFGDTNSTLAASISAVKLHIPIAHVEAGLRNFSLNIPEEVNRLVADRLSSLLFAPTKTAVENLKNEGLTQNVFLTGDVMYDSLIHFQKRALKESKILDDLDLQSKQYILATIHRQENTDNLKNLFEIISALNESGEVIVFPIHPRTRACLSQIPLKLNEEKIKILNPVGYLDSINLISNAKKVITDSGGVQKEAYIMKTPCITIFENTSWPETVEDGFNILSSVIKEELLNHINTFSALNSRYNFHYGEGDAANKICHHIINYLQEN